MQVAGAKYILKKISYERSSLLKLLNITNLTIKCLVPCVASPKKGRSSCGSKFFKKSIT